MIGFDGEPLIGHDDLPRAEDFSSFHPFLKGVFSQWHFTPFELEGARFSCAEQFMMAAKACLFGDEAMAAKIMSAEDPAVHKRLGAAVRGFEQTKWDRWRLDIVYRANIAKFSQNPGALRQLRGTGKAMLVEANPRDWNWGNGLHLRDPKNQDPQSWPGSNLLGRILTMIRFELAEED